MNRLYILIIVVLALSSCESVGGPEDPQIPNSDGKQAMGLGAFSISLAVKDLAVSRTFYEKLGFSPVGGETTQNWLILQNGSSTIGLFQEMFDKNILTFNPGWSNQGEHPKEFIDVREIQRSLMEQGLELRSMADESTVDPDGNLILIDQHVQ